MDKRLRKLDGMTKAAIPPAFHGDGNPDLLLACWGSTLGACLEAADTLRGRGTPCGVLHFSQVWPLAPQQFLPRLEKAGQAVMVEGNATGQLANLIRRETGFEFKRAVRRYDGLPFTPNTYLANWRLEEHDMVKIENTVTLKRPGSGMREFQHPQGGQSGPGPSESRLPIRCCSSPASAGGQGAPYLKANVFNAARPGPASGHRGQAGQPRLAGDRGKRGRMQLWGRRQPFPGRPARNIDLTMLVHDNQVYGLTKGQASPTSMAGFTTKAQPFGVLSSPFNPVASAVGMAGRLRGPGLAGEIDQLAD